MNHIISNLVIKPVMCDNFRPFAFTVDGTVVTGKLRFIRLRERLFSSPVDTHIDSTLMRK